MTVMRFLAACFGAVALAFRTSHEQDKDQNRPVSKVITLLHELQDKLEKEQESDESTFNKMKCQCSTGTKELDRLIEETEAREAALDAELDRIVKERDALELEVNGLNTTLGEKETELSEARESRADEADEFREGQLGMLEMISSLKAALVELKKHQESFLQRPSPPLARTAAGLRKHLQQNAKSVTTALTSSQLKTLNTFVAVELGEAQAPMPEYEAQSGAVFDTMRQLLAQFEAQLAAAEQQDEYKRAEFKDVTEVNLLKDIAYAKSQMKDKKMKIGDLNIEHMEKTKEKTDTATSLAAARASLAQLNADCEMTDTQWDARQEKRNAEMMAVAEALQVLSGDAAHDTFTRTFMPSFFQVAASRPRDAREQPSMMLSRRAKHAMAAGVDAVEDPAAKTLGDADEWSNFSDVIEAFDEMVLELQEEGEADIRQKEWCNQERHSIDSDTEAKEYEKAGYQTDVSNLDAEIENLDKEIAKLTEEKATLEEELTKAGELKDERSAEFAAMIADQQETQSLLTQAKEKLIEFYNAQASGNQNEAEEPRGAESPEGFAPYKINPAGRAIIDMLGEIIQDAKGMEEKAQQDESAQVDAYNKFKTDTEDAIDDIGDSIDDANNAKNEKSLEKNDLIDEDTGDIAMVEGQLSTLNADSEVWHSRCDFILMHFDQRKTARSDEIEALRQAKAILSGADYE